MSGSEDKPRGSLFDAVRDRGRVVSTETSASVPRGLRVATAYSWRLIVVAAAIGVGGRPSACANRGEMRGSARSRPG